MKRVCGALAAKLVLSSVASMAAFTAACGGRAELLGDVDAGDGAVVGDDAGPGGDGSPGFDAEISPGDSGIVGARDSGMGADGGSPIDASAGDSGGGDSGHPDGSTHDSGIVDSGLVDSGIVDSAPVDSGIVDSGGPDVGHVPEASTCSAGFHSCSGACVDDTAPATCGSACAACETPADGVASCDGKSCSYTCDPGYVVCAMGCCSCGNVQTEPHNCGYCGHSCGAEACVDGVCGSTVVSFGQANAYAIAADDANVYWTTTGNASSVVQAPVGGGGATVLYSSANDFPAALAVVAGQVCFTNEIQPGSVSRVPIGGGASVPVASNLSYPGALAASAGTLFFTQNSFQGQNGGSISSVAAQGGALTSVASNQALGQNPSIAVGGNTVYWTTYSDVVAAPVGGGAVKTIASQTYPYAVAADATHVYWGSGVNGGVVYQQGINGGAPITLASNQYYPNALAVDATSVYWTTGQGGTGTVMKVPIGGGLPVTLAAGQADPAGIALNSTQVFWVDFGDGSIKAVPK